MASLFTLLRSPFHCPVWHKNIFLPDIGHAFDRDHTTIMHAIRTIDDLIKKDSTLAEDVLRLKKMLGG